MMLISCIENTVDKSESSDELTEFNIEGIWIVSENNKLNSSSDIWQIESDGSFCELKGRFDGGDELHCDESGTWKLQGTKLVIKVGEEDGKEYSKKQVIKFNISKEDSDFLLEIVKDKSGVGTNASSHVLRLTKK